MDIIYFFLNSFKKNIFSYLLVVLEISSLFLAENYMISALKDREMLNIPFYPLINEKSAFAFDMNMTPREELLENVSGDYRIYDVSYCNYEGKNIVSLSDEIYENLALPLSFGYYGNMENAAIGTVNIIPGENVVRLPDGSELKLNVCGNLTQTTYVPSMAMVSNDMTIGDFYNSSDIRNTIITSRSAIKGFEDQFLNSMGFIVEFNENVEENMTRLINNRVTVVPGASVMKNTEEALASDRGRFVPLIGTVLFIVIIGTICISAITFKENELKNGILWVCGYSRAGIIRMHSLSIALITLASAVISVIAMLILNMQSGEMAIKINFSVENGLANLITAAALVGISAIIPALRSSRTSPIEYLRRAK